MKRLKESYIANGNNRPIDVYDMKGTFLKTFGCSNEACVEPNVNRRALHSVCQGVVKSCKGYRFAFHGDELKPYGLMYPCFNMTAKAIFQHTMIA